MTHPALRIDTLHLGEKGHPHGLESDVNSRLLGPSSPHTGRDRSKSLSQSVIPSVHVSTSLNIEKSPVAENLAHLAASQGPTKAKLESRKLLSHALDQLSRRPKPPPTSTSVKVNPDKAGKGIGSVMRNVKTIPSRGGSAGNPGYKGVLSDDSEDDSGDDAEYNTDTTLDLLLQLKDILLMSLSQHWDVFAEKSVPELSPSRRQSGDKSPSFLRRRSMQGGSSRSRSPSPTGRKLESKPPELLSECLSVVASIVSEDCKYHVSAPRPSKPPNALQAVILDVALILIHIHRRDPRTISRIAFAIIPAFYTFPPAMHVRLLSFFEEGVLGEMLHQLATFRGQKSVFTSSTGELRGHKDTNTDILEPMVSIRVDEALDDSKSPHSAQIWRRWRSPDLGIHSSNAPDQDVSIYHLSSVVSPLLAAIIENVPFLNSPIPVTHRLHRLTGRLIDNKPEAYLDLIGVIAYHTRQARHSAISLLLSYWPKAVGHIYVTKPFPDISYAATLVQNPPMERTSVIPRLPFSQDLPHAHQFIPWKFTSTNAPQIFQGSFLNDCRVCSTSVLGFGLNCPFCMCAVHFDCYDYPEGSFLSQYSLADEPDIQKVAVHRFCQVLPPKRDGSDSFIRQDQHVFRLVNMFSLTLCSICLHPLWGCVMQGMSCISCKQFVHSSCLQSSPSKLPRCREIGLTSTHMTIRWTALRRSFVDHFREVLLTEAEVSGRTHEEISIFYALLWTQLQLLDNGIALGSIVVENDSGKEVMDHFELHYIVQLYEAYLSSGNLSLSVTFGDYLGENNLDARDHMLYFDWNTLAYLASVVKLPHHNNVPGPAGSSDLLSVGLPPVFDEAAEEDPHPFEITTLAHIRNQLGECLNIHSDIAAKHLLSHLHHIGLLQRLDSKPMLFDETPHMEQLPCCFPLPFGFDVSVDIETLVAAIEACLSDLDLSVNEVGLLLLVRRFWPNGMLSDYTFQRLSKAILTWIFSEDDNLAIILRDYVARGRNLPGVRSGLGVDVQPWPAIANARLVTAGSANNGGDYLASRRELLRLYAAPWMLAFHDRDISIYAETVYSVLVEYAEDSADENPVGVAIKNNALQEHAQVGDKILRCIIKICQASVVFSVFNDLFQQWLERICVMEGYEEPSLSLPRLFNRELESSQRYSTMMGSRLSAPQFNVLNDANPLRDLIETAKSSKKSFERSLHWLCLFASSGVDIPVPVFVQFAGWAKQYNADLNDCQMIITAALWSSWLKSLGRQELQAVVATLHMHLMDQLLDGLRAQLRLPEIIRFVRQSLAICLLLYGCDRETLKSTGMILQEEIARLPSRRKINSRASALSDPMIVDTDLMLAVQTYVEMGIDEVSCVAAKFLNGFVNEAPLVEPHEVDNFILRNGFTLCACTWMFYGIERSEISITRASLLLRILVVDTQPFQTLLAEHCDQHHEWEDRLRSLSWLFRIVTDITSPAFAVGDRQWRASVIDVFYYFFSALWMDTREEVRCSAETWSQTLLPAHLDAIAMCWDEALSKAPISDRVKLVSFLLQLHPHFPAWRVLTWDVIIETLLEHDFQQKGGEDDGPAAAHLSMYGLSSQGNNIESAIGPDADLTRLQVSLISLSLRMITDGISIDIFPSLRLKAHICRLLGFGDVSMVPSGGGQSFYIACNGLGNIAERSIPCLEDLMPLLDASHPFDLSPSAMGGPYADDTGTSRVLCGSVYVDVLLDIFIHAQNLLSLPPIPLKNILKALLIVLYKHDLDCKPLRHLQGHLRRAVRRTLELLLAERHLSYELRELALSICHAFIKRWPSVVGNFVCEAIEAAVNLMVSLKHEDSPDDVLVVHAKSFLEETLTTYAYSGILNVLLKKRHSRDFFLVLAFVTEPNKKAALPASRMNIRDALLRDTLPRAVENDQDCYQTVIENLNTFVEVVYRAKYSTELMQFIGLYLTNVARKTAEWPSDQFNPSPLLLMTCTVIQHNKSQSSELLTHLETFVRAMLVRSTVSAASISKVMQVTTSLYRKATTPDQMLGLNHVALTILELLHDGLHGKARLHPSTITALIEAIVPLPDHEVYLPLPPESTARLADGGLSYLYAESFDPSHADFAASQAIARMILQIAEEQPQAIVKLTKTQMSVRAWNFLMLAALSNTSTVAAKMLFDYFHIFCFSYYRILSAHQHVQYATQDLAHVDISRAYASIKLWLLLCRKLSIGDHAALERTREGRNDRETTRIRMVWNELWPPFKSVVLSVENDIQTGNVPALASTIISSVTDLFLFLHQSRSAVAIEASSQIAMLNRLRAVGRAESKISRVLRSLSETPPEVPLTFFVTQTQTDIWAEEKLEAAKRQELSKQAPERMRRIAS
ncbi:hypothetical protein K474DRAFT_1638767 [Panus rudis PR-1116 ss-1]|nr:hypothetical protein K474DRAFT_1638767 [Panus rudis PR-1116 ss-1]